MATELRWIVSTRASALHLAGAIARGAVVVNQGLPAPLAEEIGRLRGELAALGLRDEFVCRQLLPGSVRFDQPLELARFALGKALGARSSGELAPPLSRRLIALFGAFEDAFPKALEELELRSEPLGGQWQARGPGLLAAIGRLTESDVLVETADVILVQPFLGGAGDSHWLYNSVHIEAVLANPNAELPEVVRLAWLVAQLQLDLPKYQGDLHRDRVQQIGPLALLPVVLTAASDVELARCDAETLTLALHAWNLTTIDPALLLDWWETYQTDHPPWQISLAALDRMLADEV